MRTIQDLIDKVLEENDQWAIECLSFGRFSLDELQADALCDYIMESGSHHELITAIATCENEQFRCSLFDTLLSSPDPSISNKALSLVTVCKESESLVTRELFDMPSFDDAKLVVDALPDFNEELVDKLWEEISECKNKRCIILYGGILGEVAWRGHENKYDLMELKERRVRYVMMGLINRAPIHMSFLDGIINLYEKHEMEEVLDAVGEFPYMTDKIQEFLNGIDEHWTLAMNAEARITRRIMMNRR